MKCPNCGIELQAGDKFCGECGAKITVQADEVKPKETQLKDAGPARRKGGRALPVVIAALAVLLVIGFLLVRYVFADQIFPLNIKVGDRQIALKMPGSQDEEEQPEEVLMENPPEAMEVPDLPEAQPEAPAVESAEEPAQPQPKPLSADKLLLEENFDGSSTLAQALFTDEFMVYHWSEGLGMINSKDTPGVLPIMFTGLEVTDFIATFEFMIPEAYQDSRAGLIFHSDTDISDGLDEYYAISFSPETNTIVFGFWNQDDWEIRETVDSESEMLTGYEANLVQIEVKGPDFRVFINNEFAVDFDEGNLTEPGLLALFIYPGAVVAEGNVVDYALFDNFKIYEN